MAGRKRKSDDPESESVLKSQRVKKNAEKDSTSQPATTQSVDGK